MKIGRFEHIKCFNNLWKEDFVLKISGCTSLLTHETSGVCRIRPDLAVNFDQALHYDGGDLPSGKGVFQPVAEEDGQRKGFTELVGTRRWTGSLFQVQFSRFMGRARHLDQRT